MLPVIRDPIACRYLPPRYAMILNYSMLALMSASLLAVTLVLISAFPAAHLYRNWDPNSSGEFQRNLQRQSNLVTKCLFWLIGFQLISLFLFIYTASDICLSLTGAMCALGSLSANNYGFPVLGLKILNFFLAGLWLILNHVDNSSPVHPLTREKYAFLFALVPLLVIETVLQGLYFAGLYPGMVTSCCGKLYSQSPHRIVFGSMAVSARPMMIAFYSCLLLTLASGLGVLRWRKGMYGFAVLNGMSFLVSMASIVSFISVYFYQLPTLHCPFCVFQKQYGYAGYVLYVLLFLGSLAGIGVGILQPFRKKTDLHQAIPAMQRLLAATSVLLLFFFMLITSLQIIFATFKMEG